MPAHRRDRPPRGVVPGATGPIPLPPLERELRRRQVIAAYRRRYAGRRPSSH